MSNSIKEAINAFSNGLPVCLFDSEKREGETDLLFSAQHVTPENMRQLRQDCGGLLFLAIGHEVGEKFGLPFLQDLHTHEALTSQYDVLQELVTNDLRYDSRSAFTLSLNHRGTYTGITDKDRCLTTRRFAELTNEVFTNNTEDKEAKKLEEQKRANADDDDEEIFMTREKKRKLKKQRTTKLWSKFGKQVKL